jgi:hypothetical protein
MKKHLYPLVAGLLIAAVSGGGGYLLGLRKSGESRHAVSPEGREAAAKPSRGTRLEEFDPAEVKRELDAEKSPLGRLRIAQRNLERWVAKDPVGALDWLASLPPSYRKQELIRLALAQFAETDGKGAAQWALGNLAGGELNNSLIAIANEWARQNGREAADWFLALPDTPERDAAVENMIFTWATNEPKAALGYVGERGDLENFTSVLRRASLAGWAKSDPMGAVAASLELSIKVNDPEQFANTIANWATVDLASSSKWLMENVEAGKGRTIAAAELGVIFAQQSPEDGVEFLGKLTKGEERNAAGNVFAAEWASFGAEGAAEWAAGQTLIELGAEAASEIAMNYFRKDPQGFERWKGSLPAGSLRDAANLAGQPAAEQ